jgi:hypothetical protein
LEFFRRSSEAPAFIIVDPCLPLKYVKLWNKK